MFKKYYTWEDVEDKMDDLVKVLINRFEKEEAQINYLSGIVTELREEIDKLKKESRVINNYYTTTQQWPQQWPQPFPQPVWCDSVTNTTGKMEMKNGR